MIQAQKDVRAILDAAVAAVDPEAAVARALQAEGDLLVAGDGSYNLGAMERVIVVGAGKASVPMSRALCSILGDRVDTGLVITARGNIPPGSPRLPIEVVEASHPIPDDEGVNAARRILDLARNATLRDLIICLWSGGGSSLLTVPARGLKLEHLQATTEALLRSGAAIKDLNSVRKHLSAVKGGLLAVAAAPGTVLSLLVSDVVGGRFDTIASGPTAPDLTTFADAVAVIHRFGLEAKIPPIVMSRLEEGASGRLSENPRADDPAFENVRNLIVADNALAAGAAVDRARELGLEATLVSGRMEGEASRVGASIGRKVREIAADRGSHRPPTCLVFGGETTVTVKGDGTGGRNQELALAAAIELDGIQDVCIGAFATDGKDGPTRAAGAIVTGSTIQRARSYGMDPTIYLADNDSNTFFCELRDLIRTGPTYTNVADIVVAVIG